MGSLIEKSDMMGRTIKFHKPIQNIVSLVPSQTEFLYHIGLADKIVGQTVFCVHPQANYKTAVKVGGTKKVKFEVIDSLQPDLIICNKEENTPELVDTLSEKYPVWVSDIRNLDDAYCMMESLGELLDAETKTSELINTIKASFSKLKIYHQYPCLYLIWRNPYMAVGSDTFISYMMKLAGFPNIITEKRYPEISIDMLLQINPPIIFLSSEPYPFTEKHILELQKTLPNSKILLVDGELFSWYGSRLVNSQNYFNELQRKLHKHKR